MRITNIKYKAFTLIELLVVIGVIGILAGIVLGVLPAAQNKGAISRVKTELKALEMVIESYKAKNNSYPPDNPKEPSRAPLYYELTGTTREQVGGLETYHSKFSPADPPLNQNQLMQLFGISGFLNSAPIPEEADVRSFIKSLLPKQVREIPAAGGLPAYKVLVAPRKGMDGELAVWQYNRSNPTNNVGEFDLWAEVNVGGKKMVIGNWEK